MGRPRQGVGSRGLQGCPLWEEVGAVLCRTQTVPAGAKEPTSGNEGVKLSLRRGVGVG